MKKSTSPFLLNPGMEIRSQDSINAVSGGTQSLNVLGKLSAITARARDILLINARRMRVMRVMDEESSSSELHCSSQNVDTEHCRIPKVQGYRGYY